MIAMQYGFILPADYDMSIIDRRVADKGHLTDGLPGLIFKAYLKARKGEQSPHNCYAPFYLWESNAGLNDFLTGPGFGALTQSFGWPSVKTWSVWGAEVSPAVAQARFARREVVQLPAYAPLSEIRAQESRWVKEQVETQGALAAVVGFEPMTWTLVRFELWKEMPSASSGPDCALYDVGHVSTAG